MGTTCFYTGSLYLAMTRKKYSTLFEQIGGFKKLFYYVIKEEGGVSRDRMVF